MRCQSRVNYSSQVCWRQVNLQGLWLQKEEEDDEFDGCFGCENDKIWIKLIYTVINLKKFNNLSNVLESIK